MLFAHIILLNGRLTGKKGQFHLSGCGYHRINPRMISAVVAEPAAPASADLGAVNGDVSDQRATDLAVVIDGRVGAAAGAGPWLEHWRRARIERTRRGCMSLLVHLNTFAWQLFVPIFSIILATKNTLFLFLTIELSTEYS